MKQGLQDFIHLLDRARREGARKTEILLVESEGLEAEVPPRGRPTGRPISGSTLRVRCWSDTGQAGVAQGERAAGESVLAEALRRLAAAEPDPCGGPAERLPMTTRGLGIDDRRFASLEISDRIDVIASAERGARGVDNRRIATRGFLYRDARTRRLLMDGADLLVEEWSTEYHAQGSVDARGDGVENHLSDRVSGRTFASISSLPFGAMLARRAIELLGSPVDLEGPVRVMLPPRVVGDLVARLAEAFLIDALREGRSLFSEGYRTRRPIVDARIHLIDDRYAPGGLRTVFFDDEGVPPVPLTLLREGIVDGHYVDVRAGRLLDLRPTGHVLGGRLRPGNLLLRTGMRSMSALLSENAGVPVLVIDHAEGIDETDLTTGAIRWKVGGFLHLGQHVQGVVRGVTLQGEVLDVLNRVVDVASDTDRIDHVDAPGMLVDGFSVSKP